MISATLAQGQANLATLERSAIKDNTLMPGEWYGGQLHLAVISENIREPKLGTFIEAYARGPIAIAALVLLALI
jgi:hypothetical protein